MAIKVIAQLREVKLGKNPGKKFVMRPDLYVPITEKKVFQRFNYQCQLPLPLAGPVLCEFTETSI